MSSLQSLGIGERHRYALERREVALNYALQFARDMDPALAGKFVGMYVNRSTLNFSDEGQDRKAVPELIARSKAAGLITCVATSVLVRARLQPCRK